MLYKEKVRIKEKKITLLRTERSSLPSYRVKPKPVPKPKAQTDV